jgi:hypothetical protein
MIAILTFAGGMVELRIDKVNGVYTVEQWSYDHAGHGRTEKLDKKIGEFTYLREAMVEAMTVFLAGEDVI